MKPFCKNEFFTPGMSTYALVSPSESCTFGYCDEKLSADPIDFIVLSANDGKDRSEFGLMREISDIAIWGDETCDAMCVMRGRISFVTVSRLSVYVNVMFLNLNSSPKCLMISSNKRSNSPL